MIETVGFSIDDYCNKQFLGDVKVFKMVVFDQIQFKNSQKRQDLTKNKKNLSPWLKVD